MPRGNPKRSPTFRGSPKLSLTNVKSLIYLDASEVVDIPNGISGLNNRHRAYVKVQDGCLLRCSYCIIPTVRPDMFSRPLQEVLDEVQVLIDNGFSEVILTGIHLGHYGVDFNQGKPKRDWLGSPISFGRSANSLPRCGYDSPALKQQR